MQHKEVSFANLQGGGAGGGWRGWEPCRPKRLDSSDYILTKQAGMNADALQETGHPEECGESLPPSPTTLNPDSVRTRVCAEPTPIFALPQHAWCPCSKDSQRSNCAGKVGFQE